MVVLFLAAINFYRWPTKRRMKDELRFGAKSLKVTSKILMSDWPLTKYRFWWSINHWPPLAAPKSRRLLFVGTFSILMVTLCPMFIRADILTDLYWQRSPAVIPSIMCHDWKLFNDPTSESFNRMAPSNISQLFVTTSWPLVSFSCPSGTDSEVETFAVVHNNGMSRLRTASAPSNLTYTIKFDSSVPGGDHRLVVYAHNPVGWSSPLKDDRLLITVVSGAATIASSIVALAFAAILIGFNHTPMTTSVGGGRRN